MLHCACMHLIKKFSRLFGNQDFMVMNNFYIDLKLLLRTTYKRLYILLVKIQTLILTNIMDGLGLISDR